MFLLEAERTGELVSSSDALGLLAERGHDLPTVRFSPRAAIHLLWAYVTSRMGRVMSNENKWA